MTDEEWVSPIGTTARERMQKRLQNPEYFAAFMDRSAEREGRIAQLEEEVKHARGMAEQNDQWEYIGVLEDRIGTLEAALVEERAMKTRYINPNIPDGGYEALARTQLEESGILTKLQNGAK